MNGGKSHRGVEGLVLERKALRGGSHARRRACGTLRTHERRRFHRGYVTAGGLVGAGASPDIQYRPRIAERSPDPCGDPRLGAPRHGVSGSDGVIQLRAGHVAASLAVTIPTPRTWPGVAALDTWSLAHHFTTLADLTLRRSVNDRLCPMDDHPAKPPRMPGLAASRVRPPARQRAFMPFGRTHERETRISRSSDQVTPAGPDWQDHDLVFCQPDGRPYRPDYVTRRFQRLAAEAGLPGIRLHDGRDTAASLADEADVSQEIRQKTLGHADAAMTSHYTHVRAARHRAAAEQVASLVAKAATS